MRSLTAVGAAAALLAAGVAVAASAGADPAEPTTTEPTAAPNSTATPSALPTSSGPATSEPSTTAPTSSEPATSEPSTTAPTSSTGPTGAAPAGAHQVTYTVTTTSDLTANIYYVTADPPDQGAANKPQYMPMARTMVGPGAPWTFQTTLNDPNQWSFVSASGGLRVNPEFRCEIAVDGTVVVTEQGGSGVQCALRPW